MWAIRMAVLGDITPSATDNSIWGETMRCADYVARQVFERSGALSLGLWGCSVKWLTPQQAWAVQAEVVEEAVSGLTTAQPTMGKDMRACLEVRKRNIHIFIYIMFMIQEERRVGSTPCV